MLSTPLLIAADPAAGVLHSRQLSGSGSAATLVGRLEDHSGFLDLGAGRVAFVDAAAAELVVLDSTAGPSVVARHQVAQPAEHLARDSTGRWIVVTTGAGSAETSASDALTVLDLGTGRTRVLRTHLGAPGVVVHGDLPRMLLRHHHPAVAESYPLAPLLELPPDAALPEPDAVLPIGELGHGEALLTDAELVALASADGVHLLDVGAELPQGLPRARCTVGWGAGRGRGFYLRPVPDQRHLVSYLRIAPSLTDTRWQCWDNEAWVLDLPSLEHWRLALGPGLVFRCAVGARSTAYTRLHPDGDEVVLVDLDRRAVSARIPLAALTDPPRPDHTPWDGAQRRSTAMSPDGAWVAVSHGGDGLVSLIDTEAAEVAHIWEVGTPLHEGGYLTVVDPAAPAHDTVNR